jgi:16S rRNA (uracil1498-N3)-methyltransferase
MQLFYISQIDTDLIELPSEEARHAVQVLRKQVGDQLDLVDGKGGWYKGTIVEAGKKRCQLSVQLIRQEEKRANYRIIMAVSPTKSNERFEWFLEKATEIGVDEIIPIQCKRTERPRIRIDRYEKVLVSAMKQSLQAWLPTLHPLVSFDEAIKLTKALPEKYIGWCDEGVESALIKNYAPPADVCIFIGPEGDFTATEIAFARAEDFHPIKLGPNRLRTETAALAATQLIAFMNQEITK